MTPQELLKDYIANHENGLRQNSIDCHYRPAVVLFFRATGCTDVAKIDRDVVNQFVDWLRAQPSSPATKRSRRRGMLTLLNYAFDRGYCHQPLYRIRKIQVPVRTPRAWTIGQVQHLVATVEAMREPPICRIPFTDWWSSLTMAAWDTGLRLGDLLSLEHDWIVRDDGQGLLRIVQSKTQREHLCRISRSTMEVIDRVLAVRASRLIWPMDFHRRKFFSEFQRILEVAELHGSFRYLRRSAVTHAESLERGLGQRLAGHSDPRTTKQSYIDESLLPHSVAEVTPLR